MRDVNTELFRELLLKLSMDTNVLFSIYNTTDALMYLMPVANNLNLAAAKLTINAWAQAVPGLSLALIAKRIM